MKTTAIVSEKGQVTIPQTIRREMGIGSGVVLEFKLKNGVLTAQKSKINQLDSLVGLLRNKKIKTDIYIRNIRGKREE